MSPAYTAEQVSKFVAELRDQLSHHGLQKNISIDVTKYDQRYTFSAEVIVNGITSGVKYALSEMNIDEPNIPAAAKREVSHLLMYTLERHGKTFEWLDNSVSVLLAEQPMAQCNTCGAFISCDRGAAGSMEKSYFNNRMTVSNVLDSGDDEAIHFLTLYLLARLTEVCECDEQQQNTTTKYNPSIRMPSALYPTETL